MNRAFRYPAAFAAPDPDAVVEAAFSCQFCLRAAAAIVVVTWGDDAVALCHCRVCEPPTQVLLSHAQALRLLLAPPPGASVELVR